MFKDQEYKKKKKDIEKEDVKDDDESNNDDFDESEPDFVANDLIPFSMEYYLNLQMGDDDISEEDYEDEEEETPNKFKGGRGHKKKNK